MLTAVLYPDLSSDTAEATPNSARQFVSNQHCGQLTQPPAARQQNCILPFANLAALETRLPSQIIQTPLKSLTATADTNSVEEREIVCTSAPSIVLLHVVWDVQYLKKAPRKVKSFILKAESGP